MLHTLDFFSRQLAVWPEARQRYDALAQVQTKAWMVEGRRLAVQWNPTRMVSTGAKIDKATLAKRPCFLCPTNRPAVQESVPLLEGRYELLVNPFPILPHHFTIPSTTHQPQRIREHYLDMMQMVELLPDLMVFYNGPSCGASAPDHLHFQAGDRIIGEPFSHAVKIVAQTPEESNERFQHLYASLPCPEDQPEPMMNILAWKEKTNASVEDGATAQNGTTQLVTYVIPRGKHRPDCYFAVGEKQMLVSPGALDMAGLVITPREVDFRRMTPELAASILREVM